MRGMRGNKGLLVAGTLLVLGCGGPKRATVPGPQVGGQRVTVVEFTPVAATNYAMHRRARSASRSPRR